MVNKLGHDALAFVDDTYVLVTSKSHEENCRLLEKYHATIMTWAEENHVVFNPRKYAVLHFRNRGQKESCFLPDIPGLLDKQRETEMCVLGFMVDERLTWQAHVEAVSINERQTSNGIC